MIPKEKAIELVSKFKPYADYTECDIFNQIERMHINAKNIALIAVDEIIESHYKLLSGVKTSIYKYWQEVKQEIRDL
jgi:hypothetical protein